MAAPYLGETLLAPGLIRLFGREFTGLHLSGDAGFIPSSNNQISLQEQITQLKHELAKLAPAAPEGAKPEAKPLDDKPRLARIYGLSYLGTYYKLGTPPVLRVFGPGQPIEPGFAPENTMDILGVEFKDADFVAGISMWPVDHLDVAVRVDITIGSFREVLLDTDVSGDGTVAGGSAARADVVGRDSGLIGRDSGLVGRDSGFVGRPRR